MKIMKRRRENKKLFIIGAIVGCVVVILLLALFILNSYYTKNLVGDITGNVRGNCGDGICQGPEKTADCPADCGQLLPETAVSVDDALITTVGDVTSFDIPNAPCSEITSAPVVVNGFILWMNHDKSNGCAGQTSKYKHHLMLYNPTDGVLYTGGLFTQSEGTISYDPEKGMIFLTTLGTTKLLILDAKTFEEIVSVTSDIRANVDTSALYVPLLERIFVGTINSPKGSHCTNNNDCGDVFAIDSDGKVVDRINPDSGTPIINSWISGAPTTNGEFLLVGGSEGGEGSWAYDCSVIKLDFNLNILAFDDPGIAGCQNLAGAQIEDAVAGEVVFGRDNTIWAQFTAPTDTDNKVQLFHYDFDFNERCRAEWDGSNQWLSASFYQGPTIDQDGNAWITWTLPTEEGPLAGGLYKVTPTCEVTEIATGLPDARVTPTLAEDYSGNHFVLVAAKGELYIFKSSGDLYKKYTLGSSATVTAAPLVYNGVIYVVGEDGTLNVIKNSGLSGLNKDAYWSTFRHEQYRTGNTDTSIQ